eukprot:Nitzschia sp. Nitz4//scaffold155_size52807//8039//9166//NITZ4_006791-RA/size52807-augustus-gene-0.52-mRNA-1//-1//CDS//3329537354//3590//frame0
MSSSQRTSNYSDDDENTTVPVSTIEMNLRRRASSISTNPDGTTSQYPSTSKAFRRIPSLAGSIVSFQSGVTFADDNATTSSNSSASLLWSLGNLAVSSLVFVIGFCYKELLLPDTQPLLERSHPHQVLASGESILDLGLSYPVVSPASVPSKFLHKTCVYLPVLLLVLFHWAKPSTSWNCTMSSLSGMLAGVGICECVTHCIKHYVQRRRPNFYTLCGWVDGACQGPTRKVVESQLSFPSGHSSIGWFGMTFLAFVLLGKLRMTYMQSSWGSVWKPWAVWLICGVHFGWATYVATSRIADYWHHASDVVAGTLLGIACATLAYHTYFPHVLSVNAGVSFAELRATRKNR